MRRTVLIFVFLLSVLMGAWPENCTALLIANAAYTNFDRLATPLPEARALKAALEKLDFAVTLVEDSSREGMLDALSDFELALRKRGGIAFFHYGGHGVQVAGKNYLLPANADIPDERRVATRAVDVDEIMASLDASGSSTNIVVLDACRNNPLPASSSRTATRGLAAVGTKPKNTIIIYSAESGRVALDGLFTPALTRAIALPGLSIGEVVMRVRREVYEKSNHEQTPGEYSQLFADVYLAGVVAKPAPIADSTLTPPVPTLKVSVYYGSVSISTVTGGALYLDGVAQGKLEAGAKATLDSVEAGDRTLELRYADGQVEKKSATVKEGIAASVSFTYKKVAPSVKPSSIGDFVLVKGGAFTMGSPAGEVGREKEEVQHQVSLSAFYIGATEVTQAKYKLVMGTNPSNFKGDDLPVESVSWYDAVIFCNKLSEREGLSKVYAINGTSVTANWSVNGYRLPTEAEWEFAARGGAAFGSLTVDAVYAGSANPNDVAWYSGDAGSMTHPVGHKKANSLGLYDMAGNVCEWCWDMYRNYSDGSQTDPVGASSGDHRVYRGGSWSGGSSELRTAFRKGFFPSFRADGLGFRLARRP